MAQQGRSSAHLALRIMQTVYPRVLLERDADSPRTGGLL